MHAVQFYEDESLFLDKLSEYIGGLLGAGGVYIVLATESHRDRLAQCLRNCGIDMAFATAKDRYIAIDADELLRELMVEGWPDAELFERALSPVLDRARAALRGRTSPVGASCEMMSILCGMKLFEAAIQVEQLWSELAVRHCVSLRCSYPMALFAGEPESSLFRRICEEHSAVIPAESSTRLEDEVDRWHLVSSLQRQASAAQAAQEMAAQETEQRLQLEAKLRRSEEFARSIIESSVDCVKVLDLAGRLLYLSPPGCLALEVGDVKDVLGRRWPEFWNPADRPRAEAAVAAALSGSVGSFHGDLAVASGAMKTWDVRITPARGLNGEIENLIAVSRDITELRVAQLAAIHAEKLATAGRMAATIAHEINNPLEAVTNFIFLAQNTEGLTDDVRGYLEVADRELTRVAHIARQTLGFYRSSSTECWVKVADLIRDALMIYERRLRNKEIAVELSVDPGLEVYGKDGELRQALLNLTANAIDASETGGRLWFRAQRTKNWTDGLAPGVRITVADNGTGMAPEVQRRVFAPFFTTKADVGTGIGLWVTKCLIEQRGGYIHFRSREGEHSGTVMSLFLPITPQEKIEESVAA